jgi:hypothetical protein
MAEIAFQPEGSDYGDRRFELSRNLNQSEAGWHAPCELRIQNDLFRIVVDGNGFIHKSLIEPATLAALARLQ